MDWKEIGEQALALLLQVAIPSIAALLVAKLSGAIDAIFAWAAERGFVIKEGRRHAIRSEILDIVHGAVLETNQEIVDELKKNGKFTVEAAKGALEHTRKKVLERLRNRLLISEAKDMVGEVGLETSADALVERVIGENHLPSTLEP